MFFERSLSFFCEPIRDDDDDDYEYDDDDDEEIVIGCEQEHYPWLHAHKFHATFTFGKTLNG